MLDPLPIIVGWGRVGGWVQFSELQNLGVVVHTYKPSAREWTWKLGNKRFKVIPSQPGLYKS